MGNSELHEVSSALRQVVPVIHDWINTYVVKHSSASVAVSTLGFSRLPQYFSTDTLNSARVVHLPSVEVPPLGKFGLPQFAEFERTPFSGITYGHTFFVAQDSHSSESIHFHELIHVLQWDALGPHPFLMAYAAGLLSCGYRDSALERMAYELQDAFENSVEIPNLESRVRQETIDHVAGLQRHSD